MGGSVFARRAAIAASVVSARAVCEEDRYTWRDGRHERELPLGPWHAREDILRPRLANAIAHELPVRPADVASDEGLAIRTRRADHGIGSPHHGIIVRQKGLNVGPCVVLLLLQRRRARR